MGALSFMGYIQGEGRQQSSLFPPTLEELVPEDHLVRVIEAYVARLDLHALGFSKAEPLKTGRPDYGGSTQALSIRLLPAHPLLPAPGSRVPAQC